MKRSRRHGNVSGMFYEVCQTALLHTALLLGVVKEAEAAAAKGEGFPGIEGEVDSHDTCGGDIVDHYSGEF